MLHRAGEGYDAVLASPYMYGGGLVHTVPLRVMLSHIANAFVKEFLGVHGILTVSSFYRLYRGACILQLQERYGQRVIERAGFESMVEMLMKMMYLEMTISEVPMVLDTSRRAGKSKLKLGRTALGYLALYRHKRRWEQRAGKGGPGSRNDSVDLPEQPAPQPAPLFRVPESGGGQAGREDHEDREGA